MRGIVLALGAGGIRGWAHVGVIKALHEAGVPIAGLVGASAGSLIGPLYAAHRDVREMVEVALSANMASLTAWFLGGLRIGPEAWGFGQKLWRCYGHLDFQELALPFAATVLDAASGQHLLVREGNVGRAVEASIRPPGLLPPVKLQGQWFVDGGLHDTVPVSLAQVAFPGLPVVAVPVGEFFLLPPPLRPASRRLGNLLWALGATPPSRLGGLALLACLVGEGPPPRPPAAATVRPRLHGIMAALPMRIQEAVRRGEGAARAALPAIKSLLEASPGVMGG
jgi:NTE family protein